LPDETSYNVIGDLKGSEHPEQIVIVSGHLELVGSRHRRDRPTRRCGYGDGNSAIYYSACVCIPSVRWRVIAWNGRGNLRAGVFSYRKEHKSDFTNHIAAIEK